MPTSIAGFTDVPGGDIHLGTANFNTVDANGIGWMITDIEGWWQLPEIVIPDDQRPFSQDGSYYQPGRYGVRNITVRGTLMPLSGTTMDGVVARRVLNEALETARETRLFSVDETSSPSGTMQADVQCTSVTLLTTVNLRNYWNFEFALRAPDPRKYAGGEETVHVLGVVPTYSLGATLGRDYTYEGSVIGREYPEDYVREGLLSLDPDTMIVNNVGTYNTGAILRLWGPLRDPSIELMEEGTPGTASYRPPKTLAFGNQTDIYSGDYYEINLLEHSVMLMRASYAPESRRGRLIPTSQWFMLEPGEHRIRFRDRLGSSEIQVDSSPYSAALEIRFRSAWIS